MTFQNRKVKRGYPRKDFLSFHNKDNGFLQEKSLQLKQNDSNFFVLKGFSRYNLIQLTAK